MLVHMIKRILVLFTPLFLSLISKNAMYLNSKLRFHLHEVFALYFGYCFMPFIHSSFHLIFLHFAFLYYFLSFFFWYKSVFLCVYIKNIPFVY